MLLRGEISGKVSKICDKCRKKPQKDLDLTERLLDEPNAGLEPAASRLEVSRATIALAGLHFSSCKEV